MRKLLRSERGATDPILVVASIATCVALLAGGTFTAKGIADRAKDSSAKNDLALVAAAEDSRYADAAVDAVPTYPAGQTFTRWTDPSKPTASTSELFDAATGVVSRTNVAMNPAAKPATLTKGQIGLKQAGSFGATSSATITDGSFSWGNDAAPNPSGGTGFLRLTASPTKQNTDGRLGFTIVDHMPVSNGDRYGSSAFVRTQDSFPVWFKRSYYDSATATTPVMTYSGYGKATTATGWQRITDTSGVNDTTWTHMTVEVLQSSTPTAAPGHTMDITGLTFERVATTGDYFDGGTAPEDRSLLATPGTALPYDSASSSATLATDLRSTGGTAAARALERGGTAFTISDGNRVVVTTDAGGRDWVAVARAQTGTAFLRSSASKTVIALAGKPGSYSVPAEAKLPATISAESVLTALTNAGGF
ncbi:hypothetical protein ACWGJ9_11620 [Curtobacterium citreum]